MQSRHHIGLILLLFTAIMAFGQDSDTMTLAEVFESNFEKATPEVKLEILKDAVSLGVPDLDAFFSKVLRYCIDNHKYEGKTATFREMAQIAILQVRAKKYTPAAKNLIEFFLIDTETITRIDILDTLAEIAPDDPLVVKTINKFLSVQNESYRKAKTYDEQLVSGCVRNMGAIGDPASFSPLLIALILGYSDAISTLTEEAFYRLRGDLKNGYLNFILEERFPDKLEALIRALAEKKLDIEAKCIIAEFALNNAIHTSDITPEQKPASFEIRSISVDFLADNGWSHATDVLVENFNIAVDDYDRGMIRKSLLTKAIRALGAMKSRVAAKRLVLYLNYLNSFTERGKGYDEEIVLQIVFALKELGDIIAQDSLLYTRYLDYPDRIKKAAFDAFQSLR